MKRLSLILLFVAGTANAQYIINEDWEGTGCPSGWSCGAGSNPDYTTSPLAGSQSLRLDGTSTGAATYLSGGSLNNSEVWFKMLVKFEALPATLEYFVYFYDGSATLMYELRVQADGTLIVHDVTGTLVAQTVSAMSVGTVYNVWGHYKAGTGANAIMEASFDVAGNPRPNSGNKFAGGANAPQTANAQYFQLQAESSAAAVFDGVQVAATDLFGGVTASPSPSNRFFLFPQ